MAHSLGTQFIIVSLQWHMMTLLWPPMNYIVAYGGWAEEELAVDPAIALHLTHVLISWWLQLLLFFLTAAFNGTAVRLAVSDGQQDLVISADFCDRWRDLVASDDAGFATAAVRLAANDEQRRLPLVLDMRELPLLMLQMTLLLVMSELLLHWVMLE